jgi:hypothetical protein
MTARCAAAVVGLALAGVPAWAMECVVGGVCVGSVCLGGTLQSCPDDGDPCSVTVCDPARGCVAVPASGVACDDGDACTSGDRCLAGRCTGDAVRCAPDAYACTDEICVDGACRVVPVDARCPGDECTTAACRPGAARVDRRGCLTTPRPDGEPCADDGIACTDDVCDTGSCLHVPIDARCGVPGTCDAVACAPERGDRDAAGCAPGTSPAAGACAEDGDACSDDRCTAGVCAHPPVPDTARCAPIRAAFRRALGLAALARTLLAREEAAGAPGVLVRRLQTIEEDLRTAADVLAGRSAAAPADSAPAETVAQTRARAALALLDGTASHARVVAHAARTPALRAALGRARCRALRRDGATVLRGTRALVAALVEARTVSGTFVRQRLAARPTRRPR